MKTIRRKSVAFIFIPPSKFKEKRASHLRELYQEKYQGQINSQSYEYAIITRSWFMPKIITVKTLDRPLLSKLCEISWNYSFLLDNISFQFCWMSILTTNFKLQSRILNIATFFCVIVFNDWWKYFSSFYILIIFNNIFNN